MGFTAKSIIIDMADNWGDMVMMGLRSVEFSNSGSALSLTESDFSAFYATTKFNPPMDVEPEYVFDTSLSKTGSSEGTSWQSNFLMPIVGQRIIVVFLSQQTFDAITVNNSHSEGAVTGVGAKNIKIYTSTDSISDTTYNASISNSTLVFDGQIAQHSASDAADDQVLTLIGTDIEIESPEILFSFQHTSELFPGSVVTPEISLALLMGTPSIVNGAIIVTTEIAFTGVDVESELGFMIETPEPASFNIDLSSDHFLQMVSPSIQLTPGIDLSVTTPVVFSMDGSVIYYLFTITGAADGTTDIEIPISSFQCRMRSGDPTYLSVVIPTVDYATQIAARANGTLKIDMAYKKDGAYIQRETIIQADLENVALDEGTDSQSTTLTGHKTETFSGKAITLEKSIYRSVKDGKVRHRIAKPNIYLRPGDTVTVDSDTFVAGIVSYAISVDSKTLEVAEA